MSTAELCGSLPCQHTPSTLYQALMKRESNKNKKTSPKRLIQCKNVKNLFFFLFSSLPKFTFSPSDRILCKIKKTKVQINKNQMHTLSFLFTRF